LVLDANLLGSNVVSATLPGNVSLLGGVVTNLGTAAVGGTANGTPYNVSGSALQVDESASAPFPPIPKATVNAGLKADVLTGQATFVNTNPESGSVTGSGKVEGLKLGINIETPPVELEMDRLAPRILFQPPIKQVLYNFELFAESLDTTSQINLVNGMLQGVNTLNSFAGASLNFDFIGRFGLNQTRVAFNANPAPNSQVGGLDQFTLAALGITVILNEQFNTCTATAISCFVETNALHLTIDDSVAGLGLGNYDIKLGHSYAAATVSAVPEPATYAMMGLGLFGVMLGARRQRRRALTQA
jgi:hypothetical protein